MKHALSSKTYLLVFIGLLLLLLITASASFIDLGPFNAAVAIGIAVLKALLILLFFMHLKISDWAIRLVSLSAFVWLGLLFTLSFSDFLTRNYLHIPGK